MYVKEDQAQELIKKNLKFLMKKKNIKTQRELANMLDISPPQLSKIMKEGQIPTVYPFLINVTRVFGVTIDQFLFTDLEAEEEVKRTSFDTISEDQYRKYYGIYQVYYYDNAVFKGRERSDDIKALRSGVLIVNRKTGDDKKRTVFAALGMSKEKADGFYAELAKEFRNHNYQRAISFLNARNHEVHLYHGELILSTGNMYISLNFGNRDKSLMIFHKPESTSSIYLGGLGAVVSVSKGRTSAPCLQYIALSRHSLNVSHGEIAEHLLTHFPIVKTYESMDYLVEMVQKLYCGEQDLQELSDEEKKVMIRYHIEKVLNDTIEKNLFRSAIVSEVDDDEFYHFLKRVNDKKRQPVESEKKDAYV